MKKIQIKLNKKQRQLREKIVAYILVVICSVFFIVYLSILFVVLFIGSFFLLIYVSFAFIFIIFGLIAYIESLILKYIWRNYNYEISEL